MQRFAKSNSYQDERGAALLAALIFSALMMAIAIPMVMVSTADFTVSTNIRDGNDLFYIAEAGLERMRGDITCALAGNPAITDIFDTFVYLDGTNGRSKGPDGVAGNNDDSGQDYKDYKFGRGSFTIDIVTYPNNPDLANFLEYTDINIKSTAKLDKATKTLKSVIRLKLIPSKVFDYAYFMNNWGWMSGFPAGTLFFKGNIAANGEYNMGADTSGSYFTLSPVVTFQNVTGDKFINQKTVGGIFAGTDIVVNTSRWTKPAELSYEEQIHPFEPEVTDMPNLSDLGAYVQAARRWNNGEVGPDGDWGTADDIGGSTLSVWRNDINDYVTYRACIGCGPGELGEFTGSPDFSGLDGDYGTHDDSSPWVILHGDQDHPIVIDGPIVVGFPGADGIWNTEDEWEQVDGDATNVSRMPITGGVIIRGVVSGHGSIYSAGNIYVVGDILYQTDLDPYWPTYDQPFASLNNTQRLALTRVQFNDLRAWRQAEDIDPSKRIWSADALGLFARENIVIGDLPNPPNAGLIQNWLFFNASNESDERRLGKDKIPDTGDTGEGDSIWDVSHYANNGTDQCGSGLILPGFQAGDPIPGSGEDIDGDGRPDGRFSYQAAEINAQGVDLNGEDSFALPVSIGPNFRNPDQEGGENPYPVLSFLAGKFPGDYARSLFWSGSDFCSGCNDWVNFLPSHTSRRLRVNRIQAVLYTNHAIIGRYGPGSTGMMEFYGSLVARTEANVVNTPIQMTHDPRLFGGARKLNMFLPRQKALEIRTWAEETLQESNTP